MIKGYGSKGDGQLCSIVNAATKVWVPGREEVVIFVLNYATLIEYEEEAESLLVPFELMQHDIKLDLTLPSLGGVGAMHVNEEYSPFEWDEEKLLFKIKKPNE
eukprot:11429345-Ditylum_brightwellii.AAC.1